MRQTDRSDRQRHTFPDQVSLDALRTFLLFHFQGEGKTESESETSPVTCLEQRRPAAAMDWQVILEVTERRVMAMSNFVLVA